MPTTLADGPLGLADSPFLRPPAARHRTHPGLVHAAGGPLAAGVPRSSARASAMLESCMTPELVVEITLQPVRRYGVDAAIFFSDIVLPLKAVGVDLDIKPGVGPVVAKPVRTLADVAAIPDLDPRARPLHHRRRCASWSGELGATPLIGFAGRPVHRGVLPRRGRPVQGARARPRR